MMIKVFLYFIDLSLYLWRQKKLPTATKIFLLNKQLLQSLVTAAKLNVNK